MPERIRLGEGDPTREEIRAGELALAAYWRTAFSFREAALRVLRAAAQVRATQSRELIEGAIEALRNDPELAGELAGQTNEEKNDDPSK